MQIPIDIEVLKSVHAMTKDEAQQIIDQTEKVMIAKPIRVKRENQKMTAEAPTNLDGGPWVIALVNKDRGIVAELDYVQAKRIIQKPITIDVQILKSVHAMTEDKARQIIEETKKVRINGDTLIESDSQKDGFTCERMDDQRITLDAPTNLGDGLVVIDLISERGGDTTLVYDLKSKKIRQREELLLRRNRKVANSLTA